MEAHRPEPEESWQDRQFDEHHRQVLDLFAVSRRSEQLFCDCEIKGSSFELDTGEICCCKCEKERAK